MSNVPFFKSNEINSMTIFDISLSLPLSPSLSLPLSPSPSLSLPTSLYLSLPSFSLSLFLSFSHKARPHSKRSSFSQSMDKLQLTGGALGRVYNFRLGCMHTLHLLPGVAIQPNLELKTRPKPVLGSLPLAFALPGQSFSQSACVIII